MLMTRIRTHTHAGAPKSFLKLSFKEFVRDVLHQQCNTRRREREREKPASSAQTLSYTQVSHTFDFKRSERFARTTERPATKRAIRKDLGWKGKTSGGLSILGIFSCPF